MTHPPMPLGARSDHALESAPEGALELLEGLIAAFNQHDADAFAALFAPDAWFVNVLGYRFSGRTEIAEAHRFVFSTALARSQVHLTDVVARGVTDDVCLVEAVWKSADEAADEPVARQGIMILLLQKDAQSRWAILHSTNADH